MGGNDVHVAFDNHHLFRLPDGVIGPVQCVNQAAFVEDRGLRRIEVLGLGIADNTATESHGAARTVADREHQPVAEAIVVATGVPLLEQTCLAGVLRAEIPGLQELEKPIP